MVALLGASAILLEEIVYNTAGTRTISLDGKVLNKKLLDNSNKTYGLAKV
jgi:translation initiation factor 2B subunit (eIF-2B alpha/beta/delta family)